MMRSRSGCKLWDISGREYLDLVAGIATCSLGHAHPAVCDAIATQSKKVMHISNLYYNQPQGELAAWLVAHSCADKVFFCNSGAEANEGAIKLARKYAYTTRHLSHPVILTAEQSFHGRTLATVTATGQAKYQKGFAPLVPGFEYVPYNDAGALERKVAEIQGRHAGHGLAAILLEPLQGEGGVMPGTQEFFQRARALCDSSKALLIFDEVQTGMGRTGRLWGYEQLGVEPDIFTSAKGLGSGFPIGALLAKAHAAIFTPGDHASTFGGNPLACATALAVANIIGAKDFLTHVTTMGEQLRTGLHLLASHYPKLVSAVRGWGLINGIVLREDFGITTSDIASCALRHGLVVVGAGPHVLRLVPPLIISKSEIELALERLSYVFSEISKTTQP